MSVANISPRNHTFQEAFKKFLQKSTQYKHSTHMVCIHMALYIHGMDMVFKFIKFCQNVVCICRINDLNCSTYNMYKIHDGILHTFTTNNYSMREMSTQIIVPGHVQHSLPILSEYYWARGMYDPSSSSSSDMSSSENELLNLNKVASDSIPSSSPETSMSSIDVQCYLIESISDIEGVELLSTDMESLMSSLSSSSSFTSESSPQFRYTYHDLLDYSPADVN